MKDASRHLKYLQRKTLKEVKKENLFENSIPNQTVVVEFTRPKVLQNKRKSSKFG
jgi:hypothetical protein